MPSPSGVSKPPAPRPCIRIVASEVLLAGRRTLLIRHGEELYRLQLTSNGKLLLTK